MRFGVAALGLATLALAGCGGGAESTQPAAKQATTTTTTAKKDANTRRVTIHVTSVVSGKKQTDRPPAGTSQGDYVAFTDKLLNARPQFGKDTNEQVGSDKGTMTLTGAHTARLEGEAVLPDGKITFAGEVTLRPNDSITVPVTGGTGEYENATGTLLVGSGDEQAANTYKLVIEGVPGPIA
jgi:Allene oxide cyclase barrel like domain